MPDRHQITPPTLAQLETSKNRHGEPTDPAFGRSDDRLREAIQSCEVLDAATFYGLLRRP
jgi:hypothetical protein